MMKKRDEPRGGLPGSRSERDRKIQNLFRSQRKLCDIVDVILEGKEPEAEIEILVIEPNPAQVAALQKAMDKIKFKFRLFSATDLMSAAAIVCNPEKFGMMGMPELLLVDVGTPGKINEFMQMFRNDSGLTKIPVILTSSDLSGDELEAEAKKEQADGVFHFPFNPDQLRAAMIAIGVIYF